MAESRILLDGREFVAKILSGEKNFRRIKLPKYTNLTAHPEYEHMVSYLKDEDIESPLLLSGSVLVGVVAPGLYAPRVSADNCNFSRSYLTGACFSDGDLSGSSLRASRLDSAVLTRAKLTGADIGAADLTKADIRHAQDLEKTRYLGDAIFDLTEVTREQSEIIGAALAKKLFVIS